MVQAKKGPGEGSGGAPGMQVHVSTHTRGEVMHRRVALGLVEGRLCLSYELGLGLHVEN